MPIYLPRPPSVADDAPEDAVTLAEYLRRLHTALQSDQIARDSIINRINLPATPATPGTPTGLTCYGFYRQMLVLWDFDPNPAIGSFEVSRSSSSGGTYTVLTHTRGYAIVDEPLGDTETWYYKVRAVLTDGSTASSLTASANATTLANDAGIMALIPTAALALQNAGLL